MRNTASRSGSAKLVFLVLTTALLGLPLYAENDPKATALAKAEMDAAGGKNWEAARYFRFDFLVDFPERKSGPYAHYWDRYTGRYRVDIPGDQGFTAYFNVNDPKNLEKAVILRKGERLTGEAAEKALARAYGRFINDSYWLLAHLKPLDPGVNLADGGEAEFEGQKARVLKLSFDGVGLTPGDQYGHFIDPATNRVLGWEYQLQNTQPPPTAWKWVDWKEHGGLMLSMKKVSPDGTKAIRFENVDVSKNVDEAALKPPGS